MTGRTLSVALVFCAVVLGRVSTSETAPRLRRQHRHAVPLATPPHEKTPHATFHLRQKACNQRGVPVHSYGGDDRRHSASAVAVAPINQPAPPPGTTAANQPAPATQLQRKLFTLATPTLAVDQVRLSRISLALYSDGSAACTGLVEHTGGPNGDLLGNEVTVRIRAFAGTPQYRGALDNAPMLWATESTFWLNRQEPTMISLLPTADPPGSGKFFSSIVPQQASLPAAVQSHFNEITHLEVQIEYRTNR